METIDGDEEEQHVAAAPAEPEPEPEPTPQAAAHVDYQHHSASSDAVAAVHENATGAQVEVLYDFTPQDDGELECKQGDILDVLDWCVFSPMLHTRAELLTRARLQAGRRVGASPAQWARGRGSRFLRAGDRNLPGR